MHNTEGVLDFLKRLDDDCRICCIFVDFSFLKSNGIHGFKNRDPINQGFCGFIDRCHRRGLGCEPGSIDVPHSLADLKSPADSGALNDNKSQRGKSKFQLSIILSKLMRLVNHLIPLSTQGSTHKAIPSSNTRCRPSMTHLFIALPK